MRNKIEDLNNLLLAQLETLARGDLKGEEFELEMKRTDAMNKIAKNLVDSHKNIIDGAKLMEKAGYDITKNTNINKMLSSSNESDKTQQT